MSNHLHETFINDLNNNSCCFSEKANDTSAFLKLLIIIYNRSFTFIGNIVNRPVLLITPILMLLFLSIHNVATSDSRDIPYAFVRFDEIVSKIKETYRFEEDIAKYQTCKLKDISKIETSLKETRDKLSVLDPSCEEFLRQYRILRDLESQTAIEKEMLEKEIDMRLSFYLELILNIVREKCVTIMPQKRIKAIFIVCKADRINSKYLLRGVINDSRYFIWENTLDITDDLIELINK